MLPAQNFFHTVVQGAVEFLLFQRRLEAVMVNMNIMSVPCHWLCNGIKPISKCGTAVIQKDRPEWSTQFYVKNCPVKELLVPVEATIQ